MDPSLVMSTNFWLDNFNGPRLGDFEGVLVGNCDGEVLGPSDRFLVGRSEKVCLLVHQTGPGSGDVWILCFGGLGGRQVAWRCRNQGCTLILTEMPVLKDEICCRI